MSSDINCNTIILHKMEKKKIKKEKETLGNTDILGCEFRSALQKVRPKDSAY